MRLLSLKECSIPTLSSESATASTSLDKANLLNISFAKSFNHTVPVLTTEDIRNISPVDSADELLCTEEEVFDLLVVLTVAKPTDMMTSLLECLKRRL